MQHARGSKDEVRSNKGLALLRRQGEQELPLDVGHVKVLENLSVVKAREFDLQVLHGKVVPNREDDSRYEVDGEPELRAEL